MTAGGELSDPFDGQGDLKRRLIRCVGQPEDRFSEDALRMFRALRFSAQLGFDIEAGTMAAIRKCAGLCAALSAERVRDETEKILMSPGPELVGTAVEYGLCAGRMEKAALPVEDLKRLAALPLEKQLRWAAFCAVILRAGLIESAREFLCAMRLDAKAVKNCGTGAIAAFDAPLPADRTGLKRLLSEIGSDAGRCAAAADEALRGGDAVRRIGEVISGGECFSLKELAVSGGDLMAIGVKPGKQMGGMLRALLEHVIDHPEKNIRTTLLNLAERIRPETQG
jgi:tRNA nucleotidyltransferase (CCA-adding enzyme)